MAVLYASELSEGLWGEPPFLCCICGDETVPPCVYWAGDDGEDLRMLFFHTECAERVGSALIADAREATLAGGGEISKNWRHRAIRLAKQRLQSEEQSE